MAMSAAEMENTGEDILGKKVFFEEFVRRDEAETGSVPTR
jgi:hypothetical protein